MSHNLLSRVFKMLKTASIQYQHEEFLRKRHFKKEETQFYKVQKQRYEKKIAYYFGIKENCNAVKQEIKRKELDIELTDAIKVREFENKEKISKIAQKASIYFQQGLEMLETSLSMPETTSPLVEYYALLQCVKGSVILDLDVNEKIFFTRHGITQTQEIETETNIVSEYINACVKPLGVFSALAIRFAHFIDQRKETGDKLHYVNMMETYFSKDFTPSIENLLIGEEGNPYIGILRVPLTSFIGSWMLSSLVRYSPMNWQEILAGQKNNLVRYIREFRSEFIPAAFDSFLPDHIRKMY